MIPKIAASAPKTARVEIVIASGFVATELAAVLDVLRIANRVSGSPLFSLRIVSVSGETHSSSLGGLSIAAERLCPNDPLPDVLVVAGGSGLSKPSAVLKARIQRVLRLRRRAILLSDAVPALVADSDSRVVVHWESKAILLEIGRQHAISTELFFRADDLVTCAGMTATYDAMLALISETATSLLANDVARVLLLERRRPGKTNQPQGNSDTAGLPDGPLRQALQIMETSLEFPKSTASIARMVGLSTRQVERIFARNFSMSPQQYYRGLRLRHARLLVESSHLSLTEISLACGFEASSNFARVFKREYGVSPFELRRLIAV